MITDYYAIASVGDPAEEPITLAEARDFLRMRSTADDAIISALISSAVEFGEKYTGRSFVQRTLEGFFSGIQESNQEPVPFTVLRRSPLVSVSSVEIMSGGSYTAFTDYELKQKHGFSRLLYVDNSIYDASPDTDTAYPLKVTFVAGYGTASDVPQAIKTALLAHVAFLYENRGDAVADGKIGMPLETKIIYSGKYRILDTF